MSESFRTRAEAVADVRKWKATLPGRGAGWEVDVWENLGWHWGLFRGPVSIYKSYDKTFHVMVAGYPGGRRCGDARWSWLIPFKKTPAAAVAAAIKVVRSVIAQERANLLAIETVLAAIPLPEPVRRTRAPRT